jgi:serine phosphatase RsbU (regulator of sigma subunit)
LLPPEITDRHPLARRALDPHVTTYTLPAGDARAGGDWCEIARVSDDVLALTIGDVCGHGEEVAATMETMRAATLLALCEARTPSDVLSALNTFAITQQLGIVTAIVAFFQQRSNTLTIANAGHPPPLLLDVEEHRFLAPPFADFPLGVFEAYEAMNHVIDIPHRSITVFYTDGITEHDRDILNGERELVAAARYAYRRAAGNLARMIADRILLGARRMDDAATMVLRVPHPPRATR